MNLPDADPEPGLTLRAVIDLSADRVGVRAMQSCILAMTWKHHVAPEGTPLEFLVLGSPSDQLTDIWQGAGVRTRSLAGPHPLFHRSPTYNKLLAIDPPEDGRRLVLIDGDIAFLGGIGGLSSTPSDHVSASVADKERVPGPMADRIEAVLGARMIDEPWMPWKESVDARVEGRPPRPARRLYFNSGVVALPRDPAFADIWRGTTARMSDWLAGQDLEDRKAVGSDQMSLSLAAGSWGRFRPLPLGCHYKVFNFHQGDLDADDISVVHLVALGRYVRAMAKEDRRSAVKAIEAYWTNFVLLPDRIRDDAAMREAREVMDRLTGMLRPLPRIVPVP